MSIPICNIKICSGYCCEHISKQIIKRLKLKGLEFERNLYGDYRCLQHNKNNGECMIYAHRPFYCKVFYCPSAIRGFMRITLENERIGETGRIK